MKVIDDYRCDSCGKVEERYSDNRSICFCDCGGQMSKCMSAPRIALDGTDSSFPGAYDRWARIREENAKIKAKRSWVE